MINNEKVNSLPFKIVKNNINIWDIDYDYYTNIHNRKVKFIHDDSLFECNN